MATLSTTAWVLHDLGLAAGFGGNLFGQLAMEPAVKKLVSKHERGKVTHAVWDRYKIVHGVALAAMAGSWLLGRTVLSGREVGRHSRIATVVKDVFVGGAVVAGVGAIITGTLLDRASGGARSIEAGTMPMLETPPRVARLERLVDVFGNAKLLFDAGIVATTAILAMQSGRSGRWSLISRLLP